MNLHNDLTRQYDYVFKRLQNILVLAFFDINIKYKRTTLGPIWNVLALLLTTILLSIVFSMLFNRSLSEYLPRVYFGITTFSFITAATSGAVGLISGTYSSNIRNSEIPLQFYIFRHGAVTLINYLHYLPIIILIYLVLKIDVNIHTFLLIPGFILLLLNFLWITTVMSIIGSRFRDVIPLTEVLMSAGTLLTPILWDKEQLGAYANYAYLNPFTFFIEAIKYPFMGINPGFVPYIGLIIFLIIGNLIQYIMIKKFGHRIPYWAS